MLAGLSNDAAMRWLGGRAWKNFQRASYLLFALLLGHGVIYQVLEKRKPSWVALFAAVAIPAIAFQFAGLNVSVPVCPEGTSKRPWSWKTVPRSLASGSCLAPNVALHET